jgi:hypothetical protein
MQNQQIQNIALLIVRADGSYSYRSALKGLDISTFKRLKHSVSYMYHHHWHSLAVLFPYRIYECVSRVNKLIVVMETCCFILGRD